MAEKLKILQADTTDGEVLTLSLSDGRTLITSLTEIRKSGARIVGENEIVGPPFNPASFE